jgi:hypothetical protein
VEAKAGWYRFKNLNLYIYNFSRKIRKYGIDTTEMSQELLVNDWSYVIFENSDNLSQIVLSFMIRQLLLINRVKYFYTDNVYRLDSFQFQNIVLKCNTFIN